MPATVVVSNRLPFTYEPDVGWRRSPGGLARTIESAVDPSSTTWVGWSNGPLSSLRFGTGPRLVGFPLADRDRRDFYEGACNRTLWPALHGMVDRVEQLRDWWSAYTEINRRVAEIAVGQLSLGDTLWIHDYHFMLVPAYVSALRSDVRIGLFLHTPFDDSAVGSLAQTNALAEGLAACHVIGTQSEADADAVERLLEVSPATGGPMVRSFPVRPDADALEDLRSDPVVAALAKRRRDAAGRRTLAVGVDRLDYTKGIPNRLLAIESLLETGVIDPDTFQYVQLAPLSRERIPAYRDERSRVEGLVERINARHRRADGSGCVELVLEQQNRHQVAGLMLAADVALVTPLRDGMNLVAMEWATLNRHRPAPLVLSSATGASDLLGEGAEVVDGTSPSSIAAGLRAVLSLDEAARRSMAAAAGEAVADSAGRDWAKAMLDLLRAQPAARRPA